MILAQKIKKRNILFVIFNVKYLYNNNEKLFSPPLQAQLSSFDGSAKNWHSLSSVYAYFCGLFGSLFFYFRQYSKLLYLTFVEKYSSTSLVLFVFRP